MQNFQQVLERAMDDYLKNPERLIRLKELTKIVSYSATSIWRRYSEGTFPKPVRLGPAAVAWRLSEVEAWMNSRESVK